MAIAPGTGRRVGTKEGQPRWAEASFRILSETAATYGATITYTDLAEAAQRRSGLVTSSAPRSWLGQVLAIVARACHMKGLPPLTSLVVQRTDGTVGAAYDAVLAAAGVGAIEDVAERELHAATARLECYRHYCDDVPEDAEPILPRKLQPKPESASTRPAKRKEPVELPRQVCQRCFIQMPLAASECPFCD